VKDRSAQAQKKIVRDNNFCGQGSLFLSVSKSTLCPIRDAKIK
jgi:hypothetical protein